ncbi:MAG: flippase-like domain-containing protein [Oscillospiraceae bacterium]|nr:flippase-like domain-containing protein [Oscillospiraceae bacterium]
MEEQKKKKKGNKLNLIICGIAFLVMVFYLLFVDGVDKIGAALSNINPLFIVLCVLFMVGYWLCEAGTVHIMLKEMHPKMRFWHTWLVTIIGQYFNCITPSASGGQPMQAYYLVKFGVPLGSAMTALLSRFIVYQFTLTIYSIFTLIVGFSEFGEDLNKKGLMIFVLIGFVINTAVIVVLIGIAVWKNGTLKAANWFISVLVKLRLCKNPMKWRVYISREVNKFHTNFKFLKKNVSIIIRSFILNFIQLTLFLSISYLLFLGFGLEGASLLQIISYQAYVLMISSFIPLPGAMGGAELGYTGFFGNIFGEYVNVSTMLWRIFTFYLPIIVGLVFTMTMKNQGYEEPTDMELKENMYNMEKEINTTSEK